MRLAALPVPQRFHILINDQPAAFKAVYAVNERFLGKTPNRPRPIDDLQELLAMWGWSVTIDYHYNLVALTYTDAEGHHEGTRAVFEALAPYVQPPSQIALINRSDQLPWRWIFRDGTLIEEAGEVTA